MTARIGIDISSAPEPAAAIWALRELFAPLDVVLTESPRLSGKGRAPVDLLVSYGLRVPVVDGIPHIHVAAGSSPWESWLAEESLPERVSIVPADQLLGEGGGDLRVPYGPDGHEGLTRYVPRASGDRVETRVDLVAAAFFWLSRYEEAVIASRDLWGRVPQERLLQVRAGLAERPLVDEYRAVIVGWAARLGSGLSMRRMGFRVCLSHDVDSLFRVQRGPYWRVAARGAARELLRSRAPRTSAEWFANHIAARIGVPLPFGSTRSIVALSERAGLTSHFFFMANGSHPNDAAYDVGSPPVRSSLRLIRDAGHRVGLHLGIEGARDERQFVREWTALGEVLGESPAGIRCHYLAHQVPGTWQACERIGVGFDSSLGFSDLCGFRSGTCHPHGVFDVSARRSMDLIEYPLAIMDKALYNLPREREGAIINDVVAAVRRHSGCVVVNWHYGYFTNRYLRIYQRLLEELRGADDERMPDSGMVGG